MLFYVGVSLLQLLSQTGMLCFVCLVLNEQAMPVDTQYVYNPFLSV